MTLLEHVCYTLKESYRLANPPGNRLRKEHVAVAKLKAPLMSLGASGKLADTLVFMPWKGINAVREYVIPANPKTALQTTQRGYFTAAVALVHTAMADAAHPLASIDQVAYAALASAKGRIITWFNQAVKLYIDVVVAALVGCVYSGMTFTTKTAGAIDIELFLNEGTPSTLVAGKFYFGSTKTNLINAKVATVVAGVSVALVAEDCSAFLTAGVKAYVQFRPDAADGCEGADSGIYNFYAA
ncbi:unnamed protein product [marine sediment metagenome]|uniref:Uncharacterized protein n=1 Tax=marine sediment metagenome TaxID=412755 RepID=X1SQC9_9ZZZZ